MFCNLRKKTIFVVKLKKINDHETYFLYHFVCVTDIFFM